MHGSSGVGIIGYEPDRSVARTLCHSRMRCAWRAPTSVTPMPADRPLSDADFVVVPPGSNATAIRIAFRPAGPPRTFLVGEAGELAGVPSTTKYRFAYALDPAATVAAQKLAGVVAGPLAARNGDTLVTLERDEIIAGIAAGNTNAVQHVKPGDDALVAALDPLLASKDVFVASTAIRGVAAVRTRMAGLQLLAALGTQTEWQQRTQIAYALVPRAKDIGATLLTKALQAEKTEDVAKALVSALGATDNLAALPAISSARATVTQTVDPRHAAYAATYSFDLAAARLGDRAATTRILGYLRPLDADVLSQLDELPYTQSLVIARSLADLFDDQRQGPRVAPWVEGPGPRTLDEQRAIAKFEADAYVRLGDAAVHAVLLMLPARAPSHVAVGLHRYTSDEVRAVRAALGT